MSAYLTDFQQKLCNLLQQGLPICDSPFVELAKTLQASEDEVLLQVRKLKELGLIRRICAIVNHRALGWVSTLVTAHVPARKLRDLTPAVNCLPGVSHNYLRDHNYNLWFTLQAKSFHEIESTLSNLSSRFAVDFHSLPVRRVFKLDVRFDAQSEGSVSGAATRLSSPKSGPASGSQVPKNEVVDLDKNEKLLVSRIQDGLEITTRPFASLSSEDVASQEVLKILRGLIDKGVIRRVAAILDHRRLGFAANVLFVCKVPPDRIVHAGQTLAGLPIVSHCYEREVFQGWPYNLFAMMHGRSADDIRHVIKEFTAAEGIKSFQLLPTIAELKKQPVKYYTL